MSKYKWFGHVIICNSGKKLVYPLGYISKSEQSVRMHHFVLGKPPKNQVVDHINGNTLDNRRENLRFATHAQNAQNASSKKTEKSQSTYLGVTQVPCNKKWRTGASEIYLGTFDTEREAAIMYDKYTYLKYGPNAKTNNLISYEEVKDLDLESLLKSVKTARDDRPLPKNITWFQDKYYRVRITYNKKETTVGYYNTVEEAVKARDEYLEKVKAAEKKVEEAHNARPITRNSDGQAIVPTRDSKGNINGHAIVDDERWHDLMKYSWNKSEFGYVFGSINKKPMSMHAYLFKVSEGKVIDHKNGVPYDNRLCNLREATHSENAHNRPKKAGTSSKYWGVTYHKCTKKWVAHITKDKKMIRSGNYEGKIRSKYIIEDALLVLSVVSSWISDESIKSSMRKFVKEQSNLNHPTVYEFTDAFRKIFDI